MSHAPAAAPSAIRLQAPHTSHERQFGLRRIYRKRSGRLRSTTSSAVVSRMNSRLIAGAVTDSVVPHQDEPDTAATRRAPAAIDLVHRYALTFQPHGRGTCGAS